MMGSVRKVYDKCACDVKSHLLFCKREKSLVEQQVAKRKREWQLVSLVFALMMAGAAQAQIANVVVASADNAPAVQDGVCVTTNTNALITILNEAVVSADNTPDVSDMICLDVVSVCDAKQVANLAMVTAGNAPNASSGAICTTINSGLIAGTVWLDADQDGVNDIVEGGLAGVTLHLCSSPVALGKCDPSDPEYISSTGTDQNGDYIFDQLLVGDYQIAVDDTSLPADLINTAGQYGVDPRTVTVLANDAIVTDQNFGYIAGPSTGIIGDRIWSDADGDGIQDAGEAGIANVTLTLRDSSGAVIQTTTSNADGDYLFTNIPFGEDYTVVVDSTDPELTVPGFIPTSGPQSEGGFVSNPVTLSASLTTVSNVDFGFDSPATLTITDRVWYDSDGDQTQDAGEPGIAGVTMNLLDAAGNVVATTITDSNGDFTFAGVLEGLNYSIAVSDLSNKLDGMSETTTTGGDETIAGSLDTAAGADNSLDTIGDDGTPTFGFNNPGSIAGTVWSDADSSELQDNGESGIGGVVVTLTPPAGIDLGNGDGQPITTTTAADGSYIFDSLSPGDYAIDILSPPAGIHTQDPDSDDDNNTTVSLGVGDGAIGQDFGYMDASLFDISGTVFLDTDKDGVEEINGEDGVNGTPDDEPGIDSISLDLIDCGTGTCSDGDETVIATTLTADGTSDANGDGNIDQLDLGYYQFPGLPDGNYVVAVTDNSALLAGYDITRGLDELPVTLTGADQTDVDFGYIKDEATGSIRGEVFIDESLINGLADDEETNLSGVVLYLCSSPVASDPCDPSDPEFLEQTTSDANGEYIFSSLPADEYVLDADPTTIPADLDLTIDPAPVALSEGEDAEADVGYEPAANTGVLSGFVWTDVDSDGVYDNGEAPIPNVDIFVYSNDGTNLTLIATVTTEPDGSWIITGISGADLQDNLLVTYDDLDIPAGLESSQPTNMPLGDDNYFPVNLLSDPDNNISFLDFAFPPSVGTDLGSIAGTIYSDVDQNGDYLAATDGELEGITLNLLDSSGNVIASTRTDANGAYSFTGLADSATGYSVVITDVQNVLQDLNPNEIISNPIPIVGGADVTDQDAGFVSDLILGSIGNKFWFDTNRNGIADDDEPGVEGVTIQCWLDVNANATANTPLASSRTASNELPEFGIDNLIRTVTTDENGEYYCTSLPSGQYIVRVFDSLGFDEANDGTQVNLSVADGNAKPWVYALTTNSPNLTADFGVSGTNSLSGKIFIEDIDLVEPNLDGSVDPGIELDGSTSPTGGPADPLDVSPDSPATGVEVVLLLEQPDGTFSEVQSTFTDANGDYSFAGLPDGDYRVEVRPSGSVIDGFGQTGDPDLTVGGIGNEELVCDSPTDALCDDATTTPITLSGGSAVSELNFGYQKEFTTTPVTVNQFSALPVGGGVEFNWETSNEVGHLGYQLYARNADEWVLLNDTLITNSGGGDALQTRSYTYTAYNVEATWFALVDVSAAEELTVHGPYTLDQQYGELMVEPAVFDWSGINLKTSSKAELSASVSARVQQALSLTANDDNFDGNEDDEDDEDDEFLDSVQGGDQ